MIYASNGDREPKLPVRDLMQKNLTVYSMSLAGVPHSDRKRAQTDIAAWTAMPRRILLYRGPCQASRWLPHASHVCALLRFG